jgi:hypothetical protein
VTITAQYKGVSKSAVLRVDPVGILSLKLIPASLAGGQDTAVRVDLNGVAGSGGVAVALTSSNPAIAPLVQSTLSIPAGATWAGTLAHTAMVTAPVSVTITARFNGVTKTATLTVRPPSLSILSVSPSSLTGGAASTTNTIWLDGPAPPGGFTVSLVSSNPAVASVPPTMVVPSGAKYVKFAIKTTPVATSTAVTISASAKGVTKTGNLTVRP